MSAANPQARATVMAHMIPFYPDEATSFGVVEALVEAGVSYLEIQFPFSDPTADGPAIEAACMQALANGFTVDRGLAFVRLVSQLCADSGIPIFVMTYASLPWRRGVERFVREIKAAGASGLIVPDLPPDSDEGLYAACRAEGIAGVPVVVPGIASERLALIASLKPEYVYCALRAGTTGSDTVLDPATLDFLGRLGAMPCKVLGGFGISRPEQVAALGGSVHAVVVGSALVRAVASGGVEALGELAGRLVAAQG